MNRPDPRDYLPLYLVTDTGLCGERSVAAVAAAAVAGGATCVQVRDKAASARELLELLTAVAAAWVTGFLCWSMIEWIFF